MSNLNGATQPFSTSEKILAYCLYMAGCEFIGPGQPCINLYDQEILFKIGGGRRDPATKAVTTASRFAGMELWDAAQVAWKEQAEGHVEYQFILTQECHDLIKAYRDQRAKMKADEETGKACDMAKEIMAVAVAGAMLPAEANLRLTCVAVKTRPEFLDLWKTVVPMLHVPSKGKTVTSETTVTTKDRTGAPRTVQATAVRTPGYKRISLNASEKMRKEMGL